ncbi:sulfotransferase [Rossellomorea sp. NPDC077527]|uniref:sulfotransferase n=1 Tax=Rossellomorea sp. NPDC077527 TaxID=3364510 RepID=UPI0037C8C369
MIKQMLNKYYYIPENIKKIPKNFTSTVNKQPLIILGNQKSGTSAIAGLLAELTGSSVTIDLTGICGGNLLKINKNKISIEDLISNNKYDFSKDILKEPALTFIYSDLIKYFPNSKYIFVIRDPRENIRSILNRIKLRGDLNELSAIEKKSLKMIPNVWDQIVNGEDLGITGQNYIEILAKRWNIATNIYMDNENFHLVKYEDFIEDKANYIERLAIDIGLKKKFEILNKTDIQFQPPGNRSIPLEDFFGKMNLNIIENTCRENMNKLGYFSFNK